MFKIKDDQCPFEWNGLMNPSVSFGTNKFGIFFANLAMNSMNLTMYHYIHFNNSTILWADLIVESNN